MVSVSTDPVSTGSQLEQQAHVNPLVKASKYLNGFTQPA